MMRPRELNRRVPERFVVADGLEMDGPLRAHEADHDETGVPLGRVLLFNDAYIARDEVPWSMNSCTHSRSSALLWRAGESARASSDK